MPRLLAALLACLALLSAATAAAAANQRRIALLRADEELLRAVSLALSPWGVETASSDASPPDPSQPEAAVRAAGVLARELEVEAVVWVSSTERGSLLWVFDVRAGEITTRSLVGGPPFDSAAAAAVALSVKTVLRSSVVAPPAERFGAQPISVPVAEPPAPTPARSAGFFAIELGVGVAWVADEQAAVRFDLATVAWIAAARRLGIGLHVATGPALTIDEPRFIGRYRELVAGGSARWRVVYEPHVSAVLSLGGAAHVATLEGTLRERSLEKNVRRVNGSLDFEAMASYHLGSAYFGASFGAAYLPSYQRYLVEGAPVFSPWPFNVALGAYGGVELF